MMRKSRRRRVFIQNWDYPRGRRKVQQSVLLNRKDSEPENLALERLHGLSRGLERIDAARSLKDQTVVRYVTLTSNKQ
jgi:hypothetical protein